MTMLALTFAPGFLAPQLAPRALEALAPRGNSRIRAEIAVHLSLSDDDIASCAASIPVSEEDVERWDGLS
jgi:hypothetical protein